MVSARTEIKTGRLVVRRPVAVSKLTSFRDCRLPAKRDLIFRVPWAFTRILPDSTVNMVSSSSASSRGCFLRIMPVYFVYIIYKSQTPMSNDQFGIWSLRFQNKFNFLSFYFDFYSFHIRDSRFYIREVCFFS